jgi:predicted nucleotidyltransferase
MRTLYKNDSVLIAIIQELKTIYNCHTIILYGSRARGDFTPASDYDVVGIAPSGDRKWIARFDEINQVFHDISVFPQEDILSPDDTFLHMSDGIVIIDYLDLGKKFIHALKAIEKEPISISDDEIHSRKIWYQKMLSRAEAGDIEGKYRYIWSVFTLLEDYFAFRKLRYYGPKKSLSLNHLFYKILF